MRYGFWIIAAMVVLVDQWTKYLVQVNMVEHGPPVPIIDGVVWLRFVHNTGVAFGQFKGGGPLLILAAAAAIAFIIAYRARLLRQREELHPLLALGLSLPLGGAIGNLLDRIRIGKVVDFVDFGWFPVFNVADTAITLGAIALMAYFFTADPQQSQPADPFVTRSEPEEERGAEPAPS